MLSGGWEMRRCVWSKEKLGLYNNGPRTLWIGDEIKYLKFVQRKSLRGLQRITYFIVVVGSKDGTKLIYF